MRFTRQWAIAFFAIVVIGSVFSALIPPMQSPDENDHMKRAYLLSVLSHTLTEPGQSTGGYFDDEFQHYQALMFQALSIKPEARMTSKTATEAASIKWAYTRHYQEMAGSAPYFPLGYFPQAVGLRIGEALNLGVGTSYRLARAATLITIATIVAYAFCLFTPNALVICLLALPMTMFQMSSASADGMSFAWTVLAASLFRRGMERETPLALWQGVLLMMSAFMIATSRPQLIAIVVLPSAVFFFRRDRRALIASGVTAAAALFWILYGASHTVDSRLPRSVTSKQVVDFYSHHLGGLVQIIWHTISNPAMHDGYYFQFVGVLGWLDRPIPAITYPVAGFALVITAILSFSRKVGVVERVLPLLVALSAVLLTFIALLVTWTDLPAEVIVGVQGRYFIAPAILAAYTLGSRNMSDPRVLARAIVCGAFLAFTVSITTSTLLWKYYL
jgi:uncharacterized membrane protein